MSYGKMRNRVDILEIETVKDSEGFGSEVETVLVRGHPAYREQRHMSKRWLNNAAFEDVDCLFRFRVIPRLEVTTEMRLSCEDKVYKIHGTDVPRGKGWVEVLASVITPRRA